ncbi:hypothetical protein [Leifsonia poae]
MTDHATDPTISRVYPLPTQEGLGDAEITTLYSEGSATCPGCGRTS